MSPTFRQICSLHPEKTVPPSLTRAILTEWFHKLNTTLKDVSSNEPRERESGKAAPFLLQWQMKIVQNFVKIEYFELPALGNIFKLIRSGRPVPRGSVWSETFLALTGEEIDKNEEEIHNVPLHCRAC